jgi:hypothetical protein
MGYKTELTANECIQSLRAAWNAPELKHLRDKAELERQRMKTTSLDVPFRVAGSHLDGDDEGISSKAAPEPSAATAFQLGRPIMESLNRDLSQMKWRASESKADETERQHCFDVVSFLGLSQVFDDTKLPEDLDVALTSPLPVELLAPASSRLLELLKQGTEDARKLPERYDSADDKSSYQLCMDLFLCFMHTWAAYNVICDEYHAHHLSQTESPLEGRMNELMDALDEFDKAMLQEETLRRLADHREELEPWKQRLAVRHRDPYPWLFDGTLADAEARGYRELGELFPC